MNVPGKNILEMLCFLKKHGTYPVLGAKLRNKCSGNYSPGFFIFRNVIPCFRYSLVLRAPENFKLSMAKNRKLIFLPIFGILNKKSA